MIQLQAVSKVFHRAGEEPRRAVHDLDLEIAKGETMCLIGASGCGKTTTLRLINRLHDPTGGQVLVDGESISGMDPVALRRRMGYVVQSGALFPHLSVTDNVGLLCRIAGWTKERTRARASELLELVHLPTDEFGAMYPAQLSGGQAQRVGVARALALDPEILLMDEPFGALDPLTRADLQTEFLELDRLVSKTVVLVTHDMEEAFRLGDRVALMDQGRLQQVGTFEDFRDAPETEQVRAFVQGHIHGA